MSLFTKLTNEVDAITTLVASTNGETPSQSLGTLNTVKQRLAAVVPEITKFVVKAREPDPEKRLYGPQMTERILALAEKVETLQTTVASNVAELSAILEPVLAQEAQLKAASERAQQEEQLRQKAEEQAQRQREEEAAAAAAALATIQRAQDEEQRTQRRLEMDRQARALAEIERQAAAVRVAERERERKAKEQMAIDVAQRKADAVDLGLQWSIALLTKHCSSRGELRQALQTLEAIVGHILEDPGDPKFRKIRKANQSIQNDLLRHTGGEECLLSLGFREQLVLVATATPSTSERIEDLRAGPNKDMETVFVMTEPDMREDANVWMEWFDAIKDNRERILAAITAAKDRRN